MTDRETRGCPILPPPVPVLDTAARRAVLGRHPRTSHARSGEARARASVASLRRWKFEIRQDVLYFLEGTADLLQPRQHVPV